MHGLSFFWRFRSIIFVLELLTLNLVCMQTFSNSVISFWESSKVFAKNTTSSTYNKSIITIFPMETSSTHSSKFTIFVKIVCPSSTHSSNASLQYPCSSGSSHVFNSLFTFLSSLPPSSLTTPRKPCLIRPPYLKYSQLWNSFKSGTFRQSLLELQSATSSVIPATTRTLLWTQG